MLRAPTRVSHLISSWWASFFFPCPSSAVGVSVWIRSGASEKQGGGRAESSGTLGKPFVVVIFFFSESFVCLFLHASIFIQKHLLFCVFFCFCFLLLFGIHNSLIS
uniref:T. congolense-specific, cell surface-expressed gene family n=1 Tax=Trypanosoma congolense (strain IL3000) TaxID=1068625 RepID=G0UMS0_TRYCI|nr:hypothetical protein, unlikely [Trypanosoma congolense IL3000]